MHNTAPETSRKFTPKRPLQHAHVQSLLASAGPRRLVVRKRARELIDNSSHHVLQCADGVQLTGEYSPASGGHSDKLAILIHGWEGCSTSSYILSAASYLYQRGYSIFHLNLRDHGDSHHLNKELFHSCRIDEVLDAIAEIQRQFAHERTFLAGFSLGGNFALRVSINHDARQLNINRIVGVCPVIDPWNAMHSIEQAMFVYRHYFTHKWKKSLRKKLAHFPHYDFSAVLSDAKSLSDLNDYFVPNHTPFELPEDYFNGYAVTGDALTNLTVATHIVTSADDPIVIVDDLQKINAGANVDIEIQPFGGHCGFLEDFRFNSWIDRRLHQLFSQD